MGRGKHAKIMNVPHPSTKKKVRYFLELSGYYEKFIPKFTEISMSLTDLTEKGNPMKMEWGPAQESAFQTLKEKLNVQRANNY